MTEIEKKALAVVDAFCEALLSKDAEIQQAVAAEVAQIVAGLKRENGLCDCFARPEGECGCGAWSDYKTCRLSVSASGSNAANTGRRAVSDLVERLRRAFDADSVAEKNLAIRAAYDFIAAMQTDAAPALKPAMFRAYKPGAKLPTLGPQGQLRLAKV